MIEPKQTMAAYGRLFGGKSFIRGFGK
ncbi:hypothetical protein BCEP4_760009 [Burkholderia cepacia]|nr:hypothetical protein BCEP4_760009 [Burkholderia cepacia]